MAVDFLAGLLFAVDLFAVDFFAVDLVGADLRAVDVDVVLFEAVFFALLFFAADFAGADFFAVVFLAVDLVLDAFLAALDLAAGADLPLVLIDELRLRCECSELVKKGIGRFSRHSHDSNRCGRIEIQ